MQLTMAAIMHFSSFLRALSALLAGIVLCASAHAASVARVTHLSGVLTAKSTEGATRVLAVRSEIHAGDVLSTAQETYARIKFVDNAEIVLRPSSRVSIDEYLYQEEEPANDKVGISMLKGGLRAVTGALGKRNRDAVSINTPTATIGIRGTHFGALFCQDDCQSVHTTSGQPPENGLHVDVTDGAIALTNAAGSQVVGTGQFGYVRDGTTQPVLVPPQQGHPVTMPTSISQNNNDGRGVGRSNENQCSAQ